MNPIVTVLLNVVLSAFIGGTVAIAVDRMKLKDRLRIEHEYEILKDLWTKAYWVKSRATSLRPIMDCAPSGDADVKKDRLDAFDKAYGEFREALFLNKPFYPADIYRLLRDFDIEAYMESYHYANANPTSAEYWDKSKENAAKINGFIDGLCDRIRRHIHHDYADIG